MKKDVLIFINNQEKRSTKFNMIIKNKSAKISIIIKIKTKCLIIFLINIILNYFDRSYKASTCLKRFCESWKIKKRKKKFIYNQSVFLIFISKLTIIDDFYSFYVIWMNAILLKCPCSNTYPMRMLPSFHKVTFFIQSTF